MFLYHVSTCSSVTPTGDRLEFSITPSAFMTRYVGIGGRVEGVKKSIDVTRGLPIAPGKRLVACQSLLYSLSRYIRKSVILTDQGLSPLLALLKPIAVKNSVVRNGKGEDWFFAGRCNKTDARVSPSCLGLKFC